MSSISTDRRSRLLTLDEVAQRLGVSKRTVQRKVYSGQLPALRLGGGHAPVRVDEAELEAWLYSEAGS